MSNTSCSVLASSFAEKAANGLIDIKFYLQNRDEAGVEDVCMEVNGLYGAVTAGRAEPLNLGDFSWREQPRQS